MNWIAALPMYNASPALAADWRALLGRAEARLAGWLAARGDTLSIVEPDGPLAAFWLRPDLLLSQTCGYPLVHALAGRVQVVATPAFDIDGCAPGRYRSVLVTGAQVDAPSLDACRGLRAAYNDDDSNSGMNLFRAAVAPLARARPFFASVTRTGGHLASLRALAIDRSADVAAIDCVTFAFVREHLPELANGVRVIGFTGDAPGLPFITSNAVAAGDVVRLADALDHAVRDDPALAQRLKLRGFVRLPADDYPPILAIEREAVALGYPRLL
ncbi:ABC-type phosphate/phosphonate transport system substrate-binding protein [Paraburkholderia sp. BL8N3]|nr:PhnD/SsuA/transferrin family substrate-binding protein [Paraburkholderia sp. BL8N3]TCK37914.1 ABC-type phosphate/phosphonate transport system substrate-binding protein [Paraburkholderia sp. BL8N3]